MLYELRTYRVAPGKLQELSDRFANHTSRFFARHGIEAIGYWTPYTGAPSAGSPANDVFTYLLRWESMGARERIWAKFSTDPDWLAVRAETERSGALVERVESAFLAPTAYSALA